MTRPDVADIRRAAIEGGALEVNGSLTAKAMLAACDWITELESQRTRTIAAILEAFYRIGRYDSLEKVLAICLGKESVTEADIALAKAEIAKRNQGSAA